MTPNSSPLVSLNCCCCCWSGNC